MKPPLSSIMGCSRRVADAKRDHSVDPNKMVCAHDPDPEQLRLYGFKGSQATRCLRCDAKLRRVKCAKCDGLRGHLTKPFRDRAKCEACNGSGCGPWRDAI
jgi:hypothetical protein